MVLYTLTGKTTVPTTANRMLLYTTTFIITLPTVLVGVAARVTAVTRGALNTILSAVIVVLVMTSTNVIHTYPSNAVSGCHVTLSTSDEFDGKFCPIG